MRPILILPVLAVAGSAAFAQSARPPLDSATIAGFRWRTVGPANFEGRVADIAAIPGPSKTFFVGTAAGGIWKTTNGGVTFRPVFDDYPVVSMGALAIAPSDTQQVWAGTGEPNSRNTIEPGQGIYKSTDGGLTWKLMGLEKTQHIGRIVVHPTNPNIVYVAALGAAWKSNPERGLYKTEDGGQNWKLVKFISDKAGFIDVGLDPKNPDVVWASSWERVRGPYFLKSGGPGSALWKSSDAGATWTEVKGAGWPETPKGRISFSIFPGNTDIVYAMVEADSVRGQKPAPGAKRQKLANGLYRTKDGGKSWEKMNDADTRPFYYSQVRVHPKNPDRVFFSSTPVLVSNDGGKTARTATQNVHVDHHAMWLDPSDPDHMIVGNDGGIAISWDGGGAYDFAATIPVAQFYSLSFDFETPYNVCAGAQDNGSWCGPSRRKDGPVTNAYWFTFAGGDGFWTAQHPIESHIIWGESQGGNISRVNIKTGERTSLVKPSWRPRYAMYEDSVLVTRGDTTAPATREQQARIAQFRTRQKADSAELDFRWNWETPFLLSPHNPNVLYAAGNRVVKSTQRGDNLYPISPDLSKKQMAKIDTSMNKTGGITLDATGAETYGTVVALAESYVRPGFLAAGTDDGNVWVTKTDGAAWEQIPASKFAGLAAGDVYVSRIEPSHFDSLTFYITFDNHRWNDFTPYVYVTTDYGKTFRSIVNNLPNGNVADYVHTVREDPTNRDLLFVGTSRAVYTSLDRGQSWQRLMSGMPTVPVHDLKIHPRDRELIAATHGRGIWIVDITPLQQLAGDNGTKVIADAGHLFQPKTAFQYGQGPAMGASANGEGHKVFNAPSPAYGAEIAYRVGPGAVASAASSSGDDGNNSTPNANGQARGQGQQRGQRAPQAQILISNARGDTVRTLTGPATAGLHRVTWDFRGRAAARAPLSPSQLRDSIVAARRMTFVFDSLEKAGTMPKPALDRIRQTMASGDVAGFFRGGGGGGGRGGAGGSGWNPRPGEGAVVGAVQGGRGEGAEAGAEPSPMDALNAFPGGLQELNQLLRPPGQTGGGRGGGGGFGGGGGGQGAVVAPGDYLVTLTVAGKTYKQLLRVERVSGGDDVTRVGFDDDEDREP